MSDGGGDRIVDAAADGGRALPAEVIAWEPVSARPGAWVTAVAFARTFEYAVVGMSDGEIWLGTNGLSATPQWTRIDVVSAPAGTSAPAWPVTALAINERSPPMIWAGYSPGTTAPSLFANQQGQSSTWRYIDGPVGNVHAISRSPFETDASVLDELAVVTAENRFILRHTVGGSWGFGGGDGWIPGLGAGTLNVTALATSGGTGSGQRRYWLGTRDGSVHVSGSQTADASAISWIRVGAPFPQRQVIAISVNPARPDEIWVTFQGLASDAVWFSPDNGQTWMNRHTYALTMEPPNEPLTAMLTAVMSYSPVPFSAVTVVDSLSSFDPVDALATFVTQDRGAAWWRRIPMILR
jgi:hypothetical protein